MKRVWEIRSHIDWLRTIRSRNPKVIDLLVRDWYKEIARLQSLN